MPNCTQNQNAEQMEKNGKTIVKSNLSVWKDDSSTGLETIRKILLAQHVEDSNRKLAELTDKYEAIFQEMQIKLQKREAAYTQQLQTMQEDFQLRFDELKSNFYQEIVQVEKKTIEHSEKKNSDFGKILIQLGKEWALSEKNE